MKKLMIAVFFLFVTVMGPSLALGSSLEGFLGIGTEPRHDFGTGFGVGLGLNVGFNDVFNVSNPSSTKNLEIRTDISYFHWEEDAFFTDFDYTRVPIFLGLRYFVPRGKIKASGLGIFGEAGFELSFDEVDAPVPGPGFGTVSDSDVNFGIPLGGGIQYHVSDKTYLGLSLRIHLISHTYTTIVGTVGFGL